jgi:hypothetical protein
MTTQQQFFHVDDDDINVDNDFHDDVHDHVDHVQVPPP